MLIIEHNMDVIKVADWIVDMGPAGGAQGGHILFSGAPDDLVRTNTATAGYLREELERFDGTFDEEDARSLDLDALTSDEAGEETFAVPLPSPA